MSRKKKGQQGTGTGEEQTCPRERGHDTQPGQPEDTARRAVAPEGKTRKLVTPQAKMVCPKCHGTDIKVETTRSNAYPHHIADRMIRRHRYCLCRKCEHRWRQVVEITERTISP